MHILLGSYAPRTVSTQKLSTCSVNAINKLFTTNLPTPDDSHALNKRFKPTFSRPRGMRADFTLIKQLLHDLEERERKLA